MIDAKQAVQAARDYFREITEYEGGVTVEEIELDSENGYWLVTLGYREQEMLPVQAYKRFWVRTEDGFVTAMKIRELAS
ncbi:MAG: hypothetical protein ACLFV7_03840 [Phycisphaerae bacterium]